MRRTATKWALVAGAMMAAAVSAAAADEAGGFRLAGVIELGERRLALLELPDHAQVTVELGDVVGGARVADVDRRSLTLETGSERIVLTLAGGRGPALAAAVAAPRVLSRQVSAAALDRLAALRGAGGNDRDIVVALNETLGLPAATEATPAGRGFERLGAVPARELLEQLYKRLASGEPVKLYLEASSADEIYLLPMSSGS